MKKEYEKPNLEIIEFNYDVKAEQSGNGSKDFEISGWWI